MIYDAKIGRYVTIREFEKNNGKIVISQRDVDFIRAIDKSQHGKNEATNHQFKTKGSK